MSAELDGLSPTQRLEATKAATGHRRRLEILLAMAQHEGVVTHEVATDIVVAYVEGIVRERATAAKWSGDARLHRIMADEIHALLDPKG